MSIPSASLIALLFLTAVLAALFWPELGIWSRRRRGQQMAARVRREDALKHIYNCEMDGRRPTAASLAGVLGMSVDQTVVLLATMQQHRLLAITGGDITLTPRGREAALHILRAHRLWEHYLAEETGFRQADWHSRAERLEHSLSPSQADRLAAQLGNPTHDPHGDPIPAADGTIVGHGGRPLTTLGLDQPAQIVHIEDEPDVVYAQLVAEGLHPGMAVRLIESTPERVRFWAGGNEHLLAPIVADNIAVRPWPEAAALTQLGARLSDLTAGKTAVVAGLSPACRGPERRRFMDLGILPGTEVTAEFISPGGDPTAYQIRGALIALRRQQADLIEIEPGEGTK